jgi:hypothetical protein
MTPKLPASSHKCCDTRPPAAVPKRPSGRSRSPRIDRSTITSPATRPWTQISPGARGTTAPTTTAHPHNHSPPTLTTAPVQISSTVDPRCRSSSSAGECRSMADTLAFKREERRREPRAATMSPPIGWLSDCAGFAVSGRRRRLALPPARHPGVAARTATAKTVRPRARAGGLRDRHRASFRLGCPAEEVRSLDRVHRTASDRRPRRRHGPAQSARRGCPLGRLSLEVRPA